MRLRNLRGVLVLVVALATACNLNRPDAATEAPQDEPRAVSAAPTESGGCVERMDWPTYQVQPGDNLTTIALRTDSTVEELAQANCLTDRDSIQNGQVLRVPNVAGSVLPGGVGDAPGTPDNCPDDLGQRSGADFVTVLPNLSFDGDCYALQGDTVVTVSWESAPVGSVEVTFYRLGENSQDPDVIGVDNDPSDGFSIVWLVHPVTPPSVLYAIALGSGTDATSDAVGMYVGGE